MKKMNIGLVGAGFMGKAHMVAFSNMPKLFTDAPFIHGLYFSQNERNT